MKRIDRRDFLGLVSSLAAFTVLPISCGKNSGSDHAAQRKAQRPQLKNKIEIDHIILISIDTLRADHLACYGHPFVQTPNIDALARESMLFEKHINAASTTLASHTSLMTGTYPHTHGVAQNGYVIAKENVMLAETLRQVGFLTAGFIGAMPLDKQFGFDQGFDRYDADYEFAVKEKVVNQLQRRAQSVTNTVLDWIDQRKKKNNPQQEKHFIFVHYFDPHMPYDAPAPFGGMYRDRDIAFDSSMEAIWKARSILMSGDTRGTKDLAAAYHAEYSAEISYCDHHVGRLLEGLKKHGIYDNAMIILTSDHGETINEHFCKISHGMSVYDTEIRSPLIIKFPGGSFGGRKISHLVSNVDLAPTIHHLLDLSDEQPMEGESFAGLIDGSLPQRDPVFAEATLPWWDKRFDSDPKWSNRGKFQCIRTDRYKYMFRLPDNQFGFYDLQNDPGEQINLLKHPDKIDMGLVKSLRQQLERFWDDVNPARSKLTDSQEAIRALRSLGYVGDNK